MKSPFGQVEAWASTQWLQGVSCSPWSSLSSDPGCLDPSITMSTVCSFPLFFSISLHTSFFSRPHSFFFTSRLFPHVPPLPYFPLSLLIFFDFVSLSAASQLSFSFSLVASDMFTMKQCGCYCVGVGAPSAPH